jgi:cyanophycinase-like exopeptidase
MKPFPHKLALPFFVAVLTLAAMPTTQANDSKGHLFIIGGGRQLVEMTKRFVELAGGESQAKIIVIPMASEEPVKNLSNETTSGQSRDSAF